MSLLRKLIFLALAAPFLLLGLFLIINAYDRHRLNQRMAFWSVEMQRGLLRGVSVSTAQEFFRIRGVILRCRPIADGSHACSGRENEQYGSLPTWHIHFNLKFSNNALVNAERVALGVGL